MPRAARPRRTAPSRRRTCCRAWAPWGARDTAWSRHTRGCRWGGGGGGRGLGLLHRPTTPCASTPLPRSSTPPWHPPPLPSLPLTITPARPTRPPCPPKAMLSSDPDALTALEGFSITRRGVGVLRWLVPVDVRGLELDAIVRIDPGEGPGGGVWQPGLQQGRRCTCGCIGVLQDRALARGMGLSVRPQRTPPVRLHTPPGEVAVYTECPKPPEGSELNAPCEVTLLEVHKKKGGQVRRGDGGGRGRWGGRTRPLGLGKLMPRQSSWPCACVGANSWDSWAGVRASGLNRGGSVVSRHRLFPPRPSPQTLGPPSPPPTPGRDRPRVGGCV